MKFYKALKALHKFSKSVWFFPVILLIPLVLLASFKISGSSIGVYHRFFYGNFDDSNLVANTPQDIRSDEWLVNTQMALAQKANNFERFNDNIGDGQDMSLILDVPYKGWSALFKPRNLVFLILPFEIAFALKWWLMGYLLIVSCYFFLVTIMPKKRLLASVLGLSLFFTPFVQWWYVSGTLGTIYYSLFALTLLIKIIQSTSIRSKILWALALTYVLVCFMFLLYPPFLVATALIIGFVGIGFLIEAYRKSDRRTILTTLAILAGSAILAGLITGVYIATRQPAVSALNGTTYPGNRIQLSGGYDVVHLMSGAFDMQFQFPVRASKYVFASVGATNQSEASNFILLMPFLLIPGIYLLIVDWFKHRKIDWPLLGATGLAIILTTRLFLPFLDTFYRLMLLDKVPHNRLLIGVGLLNIVYIGLFIRHLTSKPKFNFKKQYIVIYALGVFVAQLGVGLAIMRMFPEYIGLVKVTAISAVIGGIIYLILSKKFVGAAVLLLVLSIASTIKIHPLYRGLGIIKDSEISSSIAKIASENPGKWASESEGLIFENLTLGSDAKSLNGVYLYPQLDIWETLDNGYDKDIFNRYAHVFFKFDRNPYEDVGAKAKLISGDNFHVATEPCSDFIKQQDVRYLLTLQPLSDQDNCPVLEDQVSYPGFQFYIYRLDY